MEQKEEAEKTTKAATESDLMKLLTQKYSLIEPCVVEDEPDAHTVWLKVGVQSFCITPIACESEEAALWMQRQLCKALESFLIMECHQVIHSGS